jgi:hypothetical protein
MPIPDLNGWGDVEPKGIQVERVSTRVVVKWDDAPIAAKEATISSGGGFRLSCLHRP